MTAAVDLRLAALDLVGLQEIADRLNTKRNTPNVWRQRNQFPPPDLELAMGPLWKWSTVETWARQTGRLK